MTCAVSDCAVVATERRGRLLFCAHHARENDADALCDYDDCNAAGIEARGAQQFCLQHAAEHDALMVRIEADDIDQLSLHLDAARSAMAAWFKDTAWLVYLEVSPTSAWALRLERTDQALASVTLRVDSDPVALARQLLAAAKAAS